MPQRGSPHGLMIRIWSATAGWPRWVRLAERCGLPALVDEHVRLPASKDGTGAFPAAKLMSLWCGYGAGGVESRAVVVGLRHGVELPLVAGRLPTWWGAAVVAR
ncbi:hypothetical protein GCM10027162_22000 [Streptomyces incanus]